MKKLILILCSIFLIGTTSNAQYWEQTYQGSHSYSVTPTQDGGYVSAGRIAITTSGQEQEISAFKTDAFGEILWSKAFQIDNIGSGAYDIIETTSGNLLITGYNSDLNVPPVGPFLLLLDTNGNEIWSETYTPLNSINGAGFSPPSGFSVVEMGNGNFVLAGADGFEESNYSFAIITDSNGNLLTQKYLLDTIPSVIRDVTLCADGGLLFVGGSYEDEGKIVALKTNASLETEWTWVEDIGDNYSEFPRAYGAAELDDNFYITSSDGRISKLNSLGEEIDIFEFPDLKMFENDIIRTSDNQILFTGSFQGHLFIRKIDANGNTFWMRTFENYLGSEGNHLSNTQDGGFIIAGSAVSDIFELTSYLIKTNAEGKFYDNQLQGFVALDDNGNCSYEPNETGFEDWVIKAEKDGQVFVGSTDEDGFFDINIGSGQYQISVHPPGHYWATCEDDISVMVDPMPAVTNLDISIEVAVDCPELSVDVSSPFLRRCFNNNYSVEYCNNGTITGEDASIVITLDPFLEMISASLPYTDLGNQQVEFDLGDVPINTCGSFNFVAYLDCDNTTLGQVHCVTANIYPDTTCINPTWDGPVIRVGKQCSDDGIIFTIENIGGDMNNALDYIVIEDNIILREESFQLGAGASQEVSIEMAEGSVYHLEAEQEPLMPDIFGDAFASSTILNCNNTNPFFSSFFWFSEDDEISHTSDDCQESVGSFDPNDKRAYPAGTGEDHYLRANIGLEYKIRFQNTGTDTAFTVVIEDEISPYLDLSSVRPGVSSHEYDFSIVDNKILFTFNNIMLPDSNINEANSHGFVKFKIDQIADNPIGIQIFNEAAIFFDFNEPVITNQTFHTIGENIIVSTFDLRHLDIEKKVEAFPNPFSTYVHFKLLEEDWDGLSIELYNVNGQMVANDFFLDKTYTLQTSKLTSGIYFYKIKKEQILFDSGKIIMK